MHVTPQEMTEAIRESLLDLGGATYADLNRELGMPGLALTRLLKELLASGHLRETEEGYWWREVEPDPATGKLSRHAVTSAMLDDIEGIKTWAGVADAVGRGVAVVLWPGDAADVTPLSRVSARILKRLARGQASTHDIGQGFNASQRPWVGPALIDLEDRGRIEPLPGSKWRLTAG